MKFWVRFLGKLLAGAGFGANLLWAGLIFAGELPRVYLGTYTGPASKGIYVAEFDPAAGKLSQPELAVQTKNPSFLAVHPSQRFLYAVGELDGGNGRRAGAVCAFRINPSTGKLTLLNQRSSGGTGPCHVSVDASGKWLFTANYGSGSIEALPIAVDGTLGPAAARIQHEGHSVNSVRQEGPHAHFITVDPAQRYVLACDLGLDKVFVYRFSKEPASPASVLQANDPPFAEVRPGLGPRHIAFHPNGRFAYLISELGSTFTAFACETNRGALTELETVSTLPTDFQGANGCAEVQVHPSGKFLYGSNRGHDSIVVFAINPETGKLSYVQHQPSGGKTPRHFTFDLTGRWLLVENQDSGNIVVFSVDPGTGRLSPTGEAVKIASPICAVFVQNR